MAYWLQADDKPLYKQSSQTSSSTQADSESKKYPVVNLQPTVEAWAAKQNGTASVVIYDLTNQKRVAALNPDSQYFTASIYKLYVAYIGYQKIADGTYSSDEPYLNGYTRGECLDKMIRESYSPCGEKMWNELGKDYLSQRMKDYGLMNTSLTGLYTSASDSATILQRLFEDSDLTPKYVKEYLDSLKTQPAIYRRGLPAGFSKSIVYNKVGWNLDVEWHDAAIITLPDKHSYVITVFSKNVGYSQIAALARALESRLTD